MADAWRALGVVPNAPALAPVALVEISASLLTFQNNRLRGLPVRWFDTLEHVPLTGPTYLVANELFDALPIRQLVRLAGRWFERTGSASAAAVIWDWSWIPARHPWAQRCRTAQTAGLRYRRPARSWRPRSRSG